MRLEWAALFIAAIALYAFFGHSWTLFAILILAPDLSMLGYLAGPKVGAFAYNLFHALIAPFGLLTAGIWAAQDMVVQVGTVWIAHIAMDRALGYGLKRSSGFRDTHLGRIGRDRD